VTVRAVRRGEPPPLALPTPEQLDAVPLDALPALLVQLAALLGRVGARLYQRPARPPDSLLDAEEAATRLRTTPDWLSRQKSLPFRVELSPGQVRYSAHGLEDWIAGRRGRPC
jgi:hypothetical protein